MLPLLWVRPRSDNLLSKGKVVRRYIAMGMGDYRRDVFLLVMSLENLHFVFSRAIHEIFCTNTFSVEDDIARMLHPFPCYHCFL